MPDEDEIEAPVWSVGHTQRGFELINFSDYYGKACSLQQSSLALYQKPGSSAVWLGVDEVEPIVDPASGTTIYSGRMHLDVGRVKTLIAHLQHWVDETSLELGGADDAAAD